MRHFAHLTEEALEKIFYQKPHAFNKYTSKEILSYALGATLYIPSVHQKLKHYLMTKKYEDLTTLVICLEDGIADCQIEEGEERVNDVFQTLDEAVQEQSFQSEELPLLFIRPRSTQQLKKILENEQIIKYITGFTLPKFNSYEGEEQLGAIEEAIQRWRVPLYAMPILETKEVIDLISGPEELIKIKKITDLYQHLILNIRIGATDFSSIYGIRRSIETSIYDITVLRECMGRIINIFGKVEGSYVLSGPVWEFFNEARANEGLIKEIKLDKINGLCGKTVIHPTQISYVNALLAVTWEEYEDARQILGTHDCGVIKSKQSNKMNEMKPHTHWAEKILKRAEVYGVMNENEDYRALL